MKLSDLKPRVVRLLGPDRMTVKERKAESYRWVKAWRERNRPKRNAQERKARAKARKPKACKHCGIEFTPLHQGTAYCTDRCSWRAEYRRLHAADKGKASASEMGG